MVRKVESILLIHREPAAGAARAAELRAHGFDAHLVAGPSYTVLRQIRKLMPATVVIDLTKLPSHGREVAVAIRNTKSIRTIPIVFAGGDPQKVAKVREKLPDAVYSEWPQIPAAIQSAINTAPAVPHRPPTMMASYASTPLVRKLAIKANAKVNVIGAPEGFIESLRDLPEGAIVKESSRGAADLRIWFVRTQAELETGILAAARNSKSVPLWIAYPKKQSRQTSDLTQQHVRETGLAAGLVDYKICSIDETWTALLFACRAG